MCYTSTHALSTIHTGLVGQNCIEEDATNVLSTGFLDLSTVQYQMKKESLSSIFSASGSVTVMVGARTVFV